MRRLLNWFTSLITKPQRERLSISHGVSLAQVELAMVRLAERCPDVVYGLDAWEGPGRPFGCFMETVASDLRISCIQHFIYHPENPWSALACAAYHMNDRGVPWGKIPKALGLVPGEQPAESAPSTVQPQPAPLEPEVAHVAV